MRSTLGRWGLMIGLTGALTAPSLHANAAPAVRLHRAAQVYLDRLTQDSWDRPAALLGDLRALVSAGAQHKGLRTVSLGQAQLLLKEALSASTAAKGIATDAAAQDHLSVYISGGVQAGERFASAIGDRRIASLGKRFSDPAAPLGELKWAIRDDAKLASVFRRQVRLTLRAVARGQASPASLTGLADSLDQLLPETSAYTSLLERADAGDQPAIAELDALVRSAARPYVWPGRIPTGAPGVRAIQAELDRNAPSFAEVIRHSGGGSWLLDSQMAGTNGLDRELRRQALAASRRGAPLRFLELTHGLPTLAVQMTEPGTLRGSYLSVEIDESKPAGSPERVVKFKSEVRATVVTPRSALRDYLAGEAPKALRGGEDELLYRPLTGLARPLRPQRAPMAAGLAAKQERGQLTIREGDPVITMKELGRSTQRFDLIVAGDVARVADRVGLLAGIQGALAPTGRAFVQLTGWRPRGLEGDGITRYALLADEVESAGQRVPLASFLADRYPAAFELRRVGSNEVLVVKGSSRPMRLPSMDATKRGESVLGGYPVLTWTLTDELHAAR